MRILSKGLLWLGLVIIIAAIVYYTFVPGWETYKQYNALSAGRSATFINPLLGTAIALAAILLGGFFTGLSVGMHRHKKTPPAAHDQSVDAPAASSEA